MFGSGEGRGREGEAWRLGRRMDSLWRWSWSVEHFSSVILRMCLMLNEYSDVEGDKEFLRMLLLLLLPWNVCWMGREILSGDVVFKVRSVSSFTVVIGEFGFECFVIGGFSPNSDFMWLSPSRCEVKCVSLVVIDGEVVRMTAAWGVGGDGVSRDCCREKVLLVFWWWKRLSSRYRRALNL